MVQTHLIQLIWHYHQQLKIPVLLSSLWDGFLSNIFFARRNLTCPKLKFARTPVSVESSTVK